MDKSGKPTSASGNETKRRKRKQKADDGKNLIFRWPEHLSSPPAFLFLPYDHALIFQHLLARYRLITFSSRVKECDS
jgi:hypothetical protein